MEDLREKIQKEACEALQKYKSGTVVLPVRTGKTRVGLLTGTKYKRVLVSYPNKSILASWMEDAKKFDIDVSGWTFTTHLSLKKHSPKDYDVAIVDELDQVSLQQWSHLQFFDRIKGLTATPPFPGKGKGKYIKNFAPVVYERTLSETVGILNKDYQIYVHLVEPSKEKNLPLRGGRMWSEFEKINFFERKYSASLSFNHMLMLMYSISNSKTKFDKVLELSKKMERGLVFLETTKQCDETGLPAYHTKEKSSESNLQDFQRETISKMATISQLKAGITFAKLNEVIILHCYSSNNKAGQKIGRALNYMEGEVAKVHIVGLKGTRDITWIKNGLKEFDETKIKWIL